ncbi:NnrS family protein [Paraburkholderia sp. WC7.3g]|uniref:NnrS family protein n=1 Tax=Paraburkholderia sp. WC7.3g TaxID=2991070 RepID=UPI003D23C3A2
MNQHIVAVWSGHEAGHQDRHRSTQDITGHRSLCYGLFILATLVRVLGRWLAPQFTMAWIYASGLCWAAALVLYCVRCAAWLFLARADGKPG